MRRPIWLGSRSRLAERSGFSEKGREKGKLFDWCYSFDDDDDADDADDHNWVVSRSLACVGLITNWRRINCVCAVLWRHSWPAGIHLEEVRISASSEISCARFQFHSSSSSSRSCPRSVSCHFVCAPIIHLSRADFSGAAQPTQEIGS